MAKRGRVTRKEEKDQIERPVRYRKYKQFFLIVCEDEKTEPSYFVKFKKLMPEFTLYLSAVGTGRDPFGVVTHSIDERESLKEKAKKEIDFVWAVFDKDDADENQAKIKRFDLALEMAAKEDINIACSNEVFELWLLLHLKSVDQTKPIPRIEVYKLLEESIKSHSDPYRDFVYVHGDVKVLEVIDEIGDEKEAIKRAEVLANYHDGKHLINSNPYTGIFKLVRELRDWVRYYNWEP